MKKRTITEYEFTHAELVAWFATQFHDDIPIRWADVQTWAERTMDIGNLIAFCEAREAELAELESEPTDAQLADFARIVEGKPALAEVRS